MKGGSAQERKWPVLHDPASICRLGYEEWVAFGELPLGGFQVSKYSFFLLQEEHP